MLQRHVAYDIPGLKKQIQRCGTSQEECAKKETEYVKLAKEADRAYAAECAAMRIQGRSVRKELVEVAKDVPDRLAEIADVVNGLHKSLQFYRHFRTLQR